VIDLATRSRFASGPIRLLLLARHAGRWWDSLPNLASEAGPVFDEANAVVLAPLTLALRPRQVAFSAAVRPIARHLGVSPAVPSPDLSDETFATLLFVHLQALTAVDPASGSGGGGSISDQLMEQVIRREDDRFWQPTAAMMGLPAVSDRITRRRAMAVATLTATKDERSAAAALLAVPGLDDNAAVFVTHWLQELSTEGSYIQPLEPDRLGEYLVATVLGELPALGTTLADVDLGAHIDRLLTVSAGRQHATRRSERRCERSSPRRSECYSLIPPSRPTSLAAS